VKKPSSKHDKIRYSLTVTGDSSYTITAEELRGQKFEYAGDISVYRVVHRIIRFNVDMWETHCVVREKHHNTGVGLKLYDAAISHGLNMGFNVVSSMAPSDMAKRVWNSKRLNSKYKIVRVGKRFWVIYRKR